MTALSAGNRIGFVSLASLNRLRYLLRNLKMSRPVSSLFHSVSLLALGRGLILFLTRVCQHRLDVQNEERFLIARNSVLGDVLAILDSHMSRVSHFTGNEFLAVALLHWK